MKKLCRADQPQRTHKPFGMKPTSPFWLHKVMICEKSGSRMVDNFISAHVKFGGKRYFIMRQLHAERQVLY